ncbi:hypothetical protein HGRIS_008837 [Hohenbuehelia grisea]|uniref:Uncharacterized protein n=1 Tax=Hohenbuehelia grisea TaxID=104357 RepID=A0ABR3IZP8_9AGAR
MSGTSAPSVPLSQDLLDSTLRLFLCIGVALIGTREAPWYAAFDEALHFFLGKVVATKHIINVTAIMPQFPIPRDVDLVKDDGGDTDDDDADPPSPSLGRGKDAPAKDLITTELKVAKKPSVAVCIPDFARRRFVLPADDRSGRCVLDQRLDLLVENKSLDDLLALSMKLFNANAQVTQQAIHAFDQDSKINVIGTIAAAGRFWRYEEVYRDEIEQFGYRRRDRDHDDYAPKRLPSFTLFTRSKLQAPRASFILLSPKTPSNQTHPTRPEHSQPSGSSGPPRKRANVGMAVFGGKEPEARYTDEKSRRPLRPPRIRPFRAATIRKCTPKPTPSSVTFSNVMAS